MRRYEAIKAGHRHGVVLSIADLHGLEFSLQTSMGVDHLPSDSGTQGHNQSSYW
jgi:hypothetical protein